jgi:formylglycine-generating enzyme required for sulfatase activity
MRHKTQQALSFVPAAMATLLVAQPNTQGQPLPPRLDHRPAPGWITPELVSLQPGSFLMGSPEDELGRLGHEAQHTVLLTHPFAIGATEVTQAQWRSVMGDDPSYFDGCDDCPVEQVSWFDAVAYCNTLSQLEGLEAVYRLDAGRVIWVQTVSGYRLPTEAEWEYACRAGTTTAFYNGGISVTGCDIDPNLDAIGWYCGNDRWRTEEAAGKLPNAWELFDMSGNVWEWCWDWYEYDYPAGPLVDPCGPENGELKVTRGGSWYRLAQRCRSANRDFHAPGDRNTVVGFRVARGGWE